MFNEGNEATAAMAAAESFEVDGAVGTSVEETYDGGGTGMDEDFIRTDAAPAEIPKTLKHRGSVMSVVAITSKEKGSRGIEINAHSDSNGRDYKTTIWPPKQWTDNVLISSDELGKFPAPEGLTPAGNPKQTPLQRFGRTIKSSDGSAELQRLIRVGTVIDRKPSTNYTNFDGLVENLNAALAGTPCVFTTAPDGEPDPQYGFRIKVKSFYPHDAKFEKLKGEDASGN